MDTLKGILKFLEELEIHLALIIAGSFGSLLYISNRNDINWWQKIIAVLSGGAIANYLTPVLDSLVNIGDSTVYGFAFLLGFMGVEGVKWIIRIIKNKIKKD